MFKSIGKAVFKKVAPKAFWSLRLSALRQRFTEPELHIVPLLCDKSKTSIDIGADTAIYMAHMVNVSRDCLAFEPRPAEASKIEEMVAHLSLPVRVETVALSDMPGEAKLRILESDAGRSTIERDNNLEDPDGSSRFEITVPTRRLDDYELDAVGFIKIDVEGHELAVLRGSSETIRRCLPAMLIEIEDRHKPNSIRDVSDFLVDLGYEGYFLLNRALVSMNEFDNVKYQNSRNIGGWKSKWERYGVYVNNFFFVPAGARSRLESTVGRVKDSLPVYAT
jgi:FkbM family methyltransferase